VQGLSTMPALRELRGLWRRSLIRFPDGRSDTTTHVHWLQGEQACIDLRQPADRADYSHAHCRNALSALDCAQLARQQGFAGTLAHRGDHFEWTRVIDFQPKSRSADAGSLHWEGDLLIERGRDIDYLEHWHRDDGPAGAAAAAAALALRDTATGVSGALLRVGPHFMYARDRALPAPADRSLAECVAAVYGLEQARALVDCEISFGTAGAGELRITASTLPYRVGDILYVDIEDRRATMTDRSRDGGVVTQAWDIVGAEGAIGAWKGR